MSIRNGTIGTTEADVDRFIRNALVMAGYLVYHTHDSRRSEPGFPDICAVHPTTGHLFFAELKGDTGRVSEAQTQWLNALGKSAADVALITPANMESYAMWLLSGPGENDDPLAG